MPVFQGYPPWPISTQENWPQYMGGAPGTLFLGPRGPVPQGGGGETNTINPGWSGADQVDEWTEMGHPPPPQNGG